jgi:hypothetical protein
LGGAEAAELEEEFLFFFREKGVQDMIRCCRGPEGALKVTPISKSITKARRQRRASQRVDEYIE